MLRCSIQPLADLYISLLSDVEIVFLLQLDPSILKDAALLINEPIFLGSVTSSIQINVKLSFPFINSFNSG